MEILKNPKLRQIAFNNSSHFDFKDVMNFYKKCTAKPCSFLFTDAALA